MRGLGWRKCPRNMCNSNVLAIHLHYAFSTQFLNCHQTLDFLLSDIQRWFCNSKLKRESFKQLYSVLNTATANESMLIIPLSFEKLTSTRWLVRGNVMFNILMNWQELKAYFICAESATDKMDAKYKARLLKEMLSDNSNNLYRVSIKSVCTLKDL